MDAVHLDSKDALVIVDVQNDFLPGGNLAVPKGDDIIPVLNRAIELFNDHALPIYATRDWHPPDHCSFTQQGGIWPPHCIAGSKGAEFAPALNLPPTAIVISKAVSATQEAYSGFEGTDLANRFRTQGIERLFIGGLATDYCVLDTVKNALKQGFSVVLLLDAIRAVDLHVGDGQAAINEMIKLGAEPLHVSDIETIGHGQYV
ncbi:MAG: isochorismatase family protein [Burkholderiaceae bacterium]